MSNPLTPLNDALAIAEDSFHIARACVIGKPATPVTGTQFHPPDASFADHLIDLARTELEDLFVLAMTATFEARLKEHLKSQATIAPGIYQAKIEEWIAREIESAPLQGLAGIFKPPRATGIDQRCGRDSQVSELGRPRATPGPKARRRVTQHRLQHADAIPDNGQHHLAGAARTIPPDRTTPYHIERPPCALRSLIAPASATISFISKG